MKIYKFKDKLVVYLPLEVMRQLGLKGDEEVDFFKFSDKAFLFAKKEDITRLIIETMQPVSRSAVATAPKKVEIAQEEIDVLKKLDTLRYPVRTTANVGKLLNDTEKKTLQNLINKKVVMLFRDKKEGLYSISKDVYDRFLMRKKELIGKTKGTKERIEVKKTTGVWNENVEKLEKNGFIVLPTEAEASSVSIALEDRVRQGKILGTRAFNKKFYIILRDFFDKNNSKVIKALKDGPKSVDALVKDTGVDEDAIRAILYLLSEQGDVSERRRDVFALI